MVVETFPITHKTHGRAMVDEFTDLAGFKAAGWDVAKAAEAIAAKKSAENPKPKA